MTKLNILLADIAVLNQKVYNLHWNVEGDCFHSTHLMTEALYQELTSLFDDVAEKVKMSSEVPISTLAGYLKHSNLKEIEPKTWSTKEVASIIIDDLNTLEKSTLAINANHLVQPLLDEVFLMIDKQRWLFKSVV